MTQPSDRPDSDFAKRALAHSVHLLTASGAALGLFALESIVDGNYPRAFRLMAAAVAVDAVDGLFARRFRVTVYAHNIDGALLDNVVDYFTYAVLPAFFFLYSGVLPPGLGAPLAAAVVLSSAFQFSNVNAKTPDNFFVGFPSYWNIVALYFFLWQTAPALNAALVALFVVLSFVPVKYIYPSKMGEETGGKVLRMVLLGGTVLWAFATLTQLLLWPAQFPQLTWFICAYFVLYFGLSAARTFRPRRRQIS